MDRAGGTRRERAWRTVAPLVRGVSERSGALRRKVAAVGPTAAAAAAVRSLRRRGLPALLGGARQAGAVSVAAADLPRDFLLDLPGPPVHGPAALRIRAPRALYVPAELERVGLGGYEPDTLACVLALLDVVPDAAFFDVGANVGVFALLAAASTGREAVAFEPEPRLATVHEQLARDNALPVVVERCALGDHDGEATLYLSDLSDTSNSLAAGFRPSQLQVTVPVETLDGYCARTGRWPSVVKIDTESTEPAVLAGATALLAEHRPWIVCEVLAGRSERDLERVLAPHGYRWFQLTGELPPVERREIFGDRSYTFTNWMFAPSLPASELWAAARVRRTQLSALRERHW